MKLTRKKIITNLVFLVVIGLLLYPPTKVYFIRLVSFSPSTINKEKRETLQDYNWRLTGLNTTSVEGETLKGKIVFLNFWATWCPPCVAELPGIQQLYNDYKDKVSFVFISNEKWETIDAFYKKNAYDLPTYTLHGGQEPLFNVTSIPTTFIIDSNGEVVVNKNGAADWNSKSVRSLLDSLFCLALK